MAKIFISHSVKDQQFVEQLSAELRAYGHEPKGDVEKMVGVQNWDNALLDALTDSDVVAFLFTPNAIGSENILAEVGASKARYNLSKRPHVIPVVFPGGVRPEPLSSVFAEILTSMPQPRDLATNLDTIVSRLSIPSSSRVVLSEKVTIPWLLNYVPVTYWIALISFLGSLAIGALTLGVKVGQDPSVARLFGEKPSGANTVSPARTPGALSRDLSLPSRLEEMFGPIKGGLRLADQDFVLLVDHWTDSVKEVPGVVKVGQTGDVRWAHPEFRCTEISLEGEYLICPTLGETVRFAPGTGAILPVSQASNLVGTWVENGKVDCLIEMERDGGTLRLTNRTMNVFSRGTIVEDYLRADDWGVRAKISADKRTLSWSNGQIWMKR